MLSVLIPIYNYDVRELVQSIHSQCLKARIHFEILCFDDCSLDRFREINRACGSLVNVSYLELSENKGRAKIRNLLAKNARYDHLLFLDCDSKMVSKRFIKQYISEISGDYQIINGGREYSKAKPRAQSKLLHWTYGQQRESGNLVRRQRYPARHFHSNNFLVKRDIMLNFPFSDQIAQYGYEDLVFAHSLVNNGIQIKHIQNPIRHGSLEKTEVFLSKIQKSVDNIATLYRNDQIMITPLIKAYRWLHKRRWTSAYQWFYAKIQPIVMKSLYSDSPNMRAMDLYKLNLFIIEMDKY